MYRHLIFVFALVAAAVLPKLGGATETEYHPVSIVNADIFVKKFRTVARYTFFAEDLQLFQGVVALEDGYYESEELLEATDDHVKYLLEKIQLLKADGTQLKGKLVEKVDIRFPENEDGEPQRIRAGDLMNFEIQLTVEYTYEEPLEFLTINQQMVADGELLPSELKILLKQAGSDEPFARILKPNQPETVRFDWEKPMLPSDASDADWKKWAEEQREKTLGIESYSSTYSFVYITRSEIRHEVLIPVATLATLLEFEREETGFLSIPEQDAAKPKIETLFKNSNPVTINGIPVVPVIDRVDFYGLDLRDFAMQAERRRISMANGRVGVILRYSNKTAPRSLTVEWDMFNEVITKVESVIFPFNEIEKFTFSVFNRRFDEDTGETDNSKNVYPWEGKVLADQPTIANVKSEIDFQQLHDEFEASRNWNIPVATLLSAVCLLLALGIAVFFRKLLPAGIVLAVSAIVFFLDFGTAFTVALSKPVPEFAMPEKYGKTVFTRLHQNIFRAFDYGDQSDIYDALANSVDGPLLRELFLKINESLKVREQGGAVSRIDEVKIIEGQMNPEVADQDYSILAPGYTYRCRWQLVGSIEHWAHIHERTNEYDAVFEVALVDEQWKITSMNMIGEPKQGVVNSSLRKFKETSPSGETPDDKSDQNTSAAATSAATR